MMGQCFELHRDWIWNVSHVKHVNWQESYNIGNCYYYKCYWVQLGLLLFHQRQLRLQFLITNSLVSYVIPSAHVLFFSRPLDIFPVHFLCSACVSFFAHPSLLHGSPIYTFVVWQTPTQVPSFDVVCFEIWIHWPESFSVHRSLKNFSFNCACFLPPL